MKSGGNGMRQIVLDTETTGLDHKQGHRIIEIAAVELINRRLTGNHYHQYLNPEREIDAGALEVHGISREFLQDKPRFRDIAQEFLEYVASAALIIHNAPFDVGFLDSELGLIDADGIETICGGVVDTLKMAKTLHPGKRNNLNALCERYQVDNSRRALHGALLDSELLAEVYLAMTRGQETLAIDSDEAGGEELPAGPASVAKRPALVVMAATEEELDAHRRLLEDIQQASGGHCLWRTPETSA